MLEKLLDSNDLANLLTSEEVIQVCIGQYQSIVKFTNSLHISVECSFRICFPSQILEASAEDPTTSRKLTSLLGKELETFQIENNALRIIFSDRSSLELIMRDDGYESFSITKGEEAVYL